MTSVEVPALPCGASRHNTSCLNKLAIAIVATAVLNKHTEGSGEFEAHCDGDIARAVASGVRAIKFVGMEWASNYVRHLVADAITVVPRKCI